MPVIQVRHNGPNFSYLPYPEVPRPTPRLIRALGSIENTDLAVYPAGFIGDLVPEVWKLERPSLQYILEVEASGEAARLTFSEDASQIPPEALRNATKTPDPIGGARAETSLQIGEPLSDHAYVAIPNPDFMLVGGLVLRAEQPIIDFLQTKFPTTYIE